MSRPALLTRAPAGTAPLLLSRTGGHVSRLPGALVDCCSEAVADRSGSDGQVAAWATEQQPPRSRAKPTLTLGFGRKRSPAAAQVGSDRDDRSVAIAIARPAPAREQKQSRRAQAAHARIWAKPEAAGVCSTLSIEQATTRQCICTLWKPRRRNPRLRLPLRLAKRRCHRRGSASHITAPRDGSTRVLLLPTSRAGEPHKCAAGLPPPFHTGNLAGREGHARYLGRKQQLEAAVRRRDDPRGSSPFRAEETVAPDGGRPAGTRAQVSASGRACTIWRAQVPAFVIESDAYFGVGAEPVRGV